MDVLVTGELDFTVQGIFLETEFKQDPFVYQAEHAALLSKEIPDLNFIGYIPLNVAQHHDGSVQLSLGFQRADLEQNEGVDIQTINGVWSEEVDLDIGGADIEEAENLIVSLPDTIDL